MQNDRYDDGARHKWFNPQINIGHIITTLGAIVACFWYVAQLDREITGLKRDLEHEREIRETIYEHLKDELSEHEAAAGKEHSETRDLLKELYLLIRPGR